MHLGRGTFVIIVALILATLGGTFIGGRLSAQDLPALGIRGQLMARLQADKKWITTAAGLEIGVI